MKPVNLTCVNCSKELDLGLYYYCPKCNSPLEVKFDYSKMDNISFKDINRNGIWQYDTCASMVPDQNHISLGEGNTPLVRLKRLGIQNNLPNVYIKNEGLNPTGSFKDRPTSLGISFALSRHIDHAVISSTGNAGASLAAYAAAAGLDAVVLVPQGVPQEKLTQIAVHGSTIIQVAGSVSDSLNLGIKVSKYYGWINLTSTFLNPYSIVANRTVAYELFEQLDEVPDWIVVPVGVGPLLVGIYKGFQDLLTKKMINKMPKMVAAQAEQCSPIYKAFVNSAEFVQEWDSPINTIAGGIGDPLIGYRNDGTYTLRTVLESQGIVTQSNEEEIIESCRLLAKQEGIFCEPTSAVAYAAVKRVVKHPSFDNSQSVVLILTGHGLKQQAVFANDFTLNDPIQADLSHFDKLYSKVK